MVINYIYIFKNLFSLGKLKKKSVQRTCNNTCTYDHTHMTNWNCAF